MVTILAKGALALLIGLTAPVVSAASADVPRAHSVTSSVRPTVRPDLARLPALRWDHINGASGWTRAAMRALGAHGAPLVDLVPADIAQWCPAYPHSGPWARKAFWAGLLSTLAKHESTYRPRVVGGGGKWVGLVQILPATARGYGCTAHTREALKDGAANMS